MTLQFSKDFKYIYKLNTDGSITATMKDLLTEEELQRFYAQVAKEKYA